MVQESYQIGFFKDQWSLSSAWKRMRGLRKKRVLLGTMTIPPHLTISGTTITIGNMDEEIAISKKNVKSIDIVRMPFSQVKVGLVISAVYLAVVSLVLFLISRSDFSSSFGEELFAAVAISTLLFALYTLVFCIRFRYIRIIHGDKGKEKIIHLYGIPSLPVRYVEWWQQGAYLEVTKEIYKKLTT
jgi:hypothetical protein